MLGNSILLISSNSNNTAILCVNGKSISIDMQIAFNDFSTHY